MGDNDQKPPVDRSRKPSPEQIRQLYMASDHIEWTPFAKSKGWDGLDSRHGLPIGDWITEKRNIIAREQAEAIAEAVFTHRSRWHKDVLDTLKRYPEANDAMLSILGRRLNDIVETINDDDTKRKMALQQGGDFTARFAAIKTSELTALAAALKICTEAKHKSLMINDWSFKVAETFSDPRQFQNDTDKVKSTEWKVQIIGGGDITSAQMQDFLGKWYDRPLMPHTEEEVDAGTALPVADEPEDE